ncbi:unnamed protein product [Laminaria digitata]
MVNVRDRRCLHDACTRRPAFNLVGRKTAGYCKQHAEDRMDVLSKRCFHGSCTRRPTFNIVGSITAAYCKQHAEDGMVNVLHNSCSHDSCKKLSSFSVIGSKAVYCKHHSDTGIVDVLSGRCSHDSCTMIPLWGVHTEVSASVCARHKSDLPAGPVINFKARCKVASCPKVFKWGLDGKQLTHCPD